MKEYTTYTAIETDDSKYKLSALLNKDGSYCMVSLFVTLKDGSETNWDNDKFLIESLLPSLKKNRLEADQSYKKIPKNRRKEVKQLIKTGIKLGFFKNI